MNIQDVAKDLQSKVDTKKIVSDLQAKVNESGQVIAKVAEENKGALVGAALGAALSNDKKVQGAILGAIAGALIVDRKND